MTFGLHSAGEPRNVHQIGGYVLRRWLAQGGMAELFLAHAADRALPRRVVVVKRILPQFAEDSQFMRMFAREVEVASALHHPNIIKVFDAGQIGGQDCFLAMEYVHGVDLSRVLNVLRELREPLPLQHAITIAVGMCAGLHHAHESTDDEGLPLGIVHRDVSPSNVLLGYDGVVKVADFGVAKALALTSFTQAGTRKGKLSYMAPEQARAEPIDRRADVFAIGAVLYEMTTMRRLFSGENELAIMHQLLFRERPLPSSIVRGYPPELEAIVLQAVASEPSDRPSTAQALQRALEAFAKHHSLVISEPAVGAFLRSLLPPPEHPSDDPNFFDDHAPASLGPHHPSTLVDGGVATVQTGRSGETAAASAQMPAVAGTLHAPSAEFAPVIEHPVVRTQRAMPAIPPPPEFVSDVAAARSGFGGLVGAIALGVALFGIGSYVLLRPRSEQPSPVPARSDAREPADANPAIEAPPELAPAPVVVAPSEPAAIEPAPTPTEAQAPAETEPESRRKKKKRPSSKAAEKAEATDVRRPPPPPPPSNQGEKPKTDRLLPL